jgi:hypothetical protein
MGIVRIALESALAILQEHVKKLMFDTWDIMRGLVALMALAKERKTRK